MPGRTFDVDHLVHRSPPQVGVDDQGFRAALGKGNAEVVCGQRLPLPATALENDERLLLPFAGGEQNRCSDRAVGSKPPAANDSER